MNEIVLSRDVGAASERVWNVMTDLERAPEVLSAVDRIERMDDHADFGVGTRWRETRTLFGKQATEELEVTSVQQGRSYTVEADSRGAHYRSTMRVEPLGPDRSRLHLTFGAEPGSLLGRIFSAAIGRLFAGATRKALQGDLDDIAAAAESGTGVAVPAGAD